MKIFTEEDIKFRYIEPTLEKTGWKLEQIYKEYYFTDGQIIVRGKTVKRGKGKKADYILTHKEGDIPLAIIEAKSGEFSIGSGMKQAIDYAQILDIPFAYSTNGEGFIEHDFFTGKEKELKLEEFPKEDELWDRYLKGKNLNTKQEEIITEPNHFDTFTKKKPRYYQRIAIDRTVEAIAKGQKRILLVMATGECVIIVMGAVYVMKPRVSGTLDKYISCIA